MPRDPRPEPLYRLVGLTYVTDPRVRALSPHARIVLDVLLLGPNSLPTPGVALGLGRRGLGEIADLADADITKAFDELVASGARVDWTALLVWLPWAVDLMPAPISPNHAKAWRVALARLPRCPLTDEIRRFFDQVLAGSTPATPAPEVRAPLLAAAESPVENLCGPVEKIAAVSPGEDIEPGDYQDRELDQPDTKRERIGPVEREREEEDQELTAPDGADLTRPIDPKTFRRLCAIAASVLDEEPGLRLADLTDEVKTRAARQGIRDRDRRVDARSMVVCAVDAVLHARSRRWSPSIRDPTPAMST